MGNIMVDMIHCIFPANKKIAQRVHEVIKEWEHTQNHAENGLKSLMAEFKKQWQDVIHDTLAQDQMTSEKPDLPETLLGKLIDSFFLKIHFPSV